MLRDAINEAIDRDSYLMPCAMVIILGYCCVMLGQRFNCVSSLGLLGVLGLLSVGLAVLCTMTMGILCQVGIISVV